MKGATFVSPLNRTDAALTSKLGENVPMVFLWVPKMSSEDLTQPVCTRE